VGRRRGDLCAAEKVSRDTNGPVDRLSPCERPGRWPGAACKARLAGRARTRAHRDL